MARVGVNLEGRKGTAELSRIPVRGDFLPVGRGSAVEVTDVVLFSPDSDVAAVVFAVPAQRNLAIESDSGVLSFDEDSGA